MADNRSVVGTFRDFEFARSRGSAKGRSCVAVLVQRPHDVFWTRNATDLAIDVVDWSVDPPDGNAGLWRAVELDPLSPEAPVAVRHPAASTKFNATNDVADITVSAELRNFHDAPINGSITITLGEDVHCTVGPVRVEGAPSGGIAPGAGPEGRAYGRLLVAVDAKQCAGLAVRGASARGLLWWPWQMGAQPLHNLTVAFRADQQ